MERVSRRELLVAGAVAGVALGFGRTAIARTRAASASLDFAATGTGDGWPGWVCPGVANLRRDGGLGLLEAGSDVFPCDPRPVAFALDQRFRDGTIEAALNATGAGAGLVLRRTGPRDYYAAILDDEQHALILLKRTPLGATELAQAPAPPARTGPLTMTFTATGAHPTQLTATAGPLTTVTGTDGSAPLQRAGDPGVLATARTLFPSEGPAPLPALGNLHLLPYGVQEGQAVFDTAVGQQVMAQIRERSTAAFESIAIKPASRTQPTRPSVIAAIAGPGALRVATDVPARVEIELARNRHFRHARRLTPVSTNAFGAVQIDRTPTGKRVYWRARTRRHGREAIGPTRSFKPLPKPGSHARATIAIGACAAQFGPIFDAIAARKPDAFVWQGDLNYPDTVGPLAQTVPGYAGIWRDFLANPRLAPILGRSLFAPQRDDHDYGVQDANSTNILPHGLKPWEALMERRLYYRFAAGLAEVWVLDQRRRKSDPTAPDTPTKTLLGERQRNWLLRTLAASKAPFKVVCSPCTLAPLPANGRDGSWAEGFNAERDLVLAHVRDRVAGQTVFVTGDTHWTMVYERAGLFEARPCPLGIPTPNDITITDPQAAEDARATPGVAYADDDKGHVAFLTVRGHGGKARLDLSLLREDGATPYRKRFEQPL